MSEIVKQKLELASRFAKPRLSSRGRGIVLRKINIDPSQRYIRQPLLPIKGEYRIYGLFSSILPVAAVRSSKTATSKVKVIGVEEIPQNLLGFAEKVYKKLPRLELVGFDVVLLEDGRPILLEINRSPQFTRYNEVTGINLAEEFMKGLV